MASKRDTQSSWEEKIYRAVKAREDWAREFREDLGHAYFEGKQNPGGWNDDEWINVDKIYSRVTGLIPSLVDQEPYFYVKLRRTFDPHPMQVALMQERARIRQAKLNYTWREAQATNTVRLSVQDAQFSYGVCKAHFSSRQMENPRAGQQIFADGSQEPLLDDDGQPLIEPDMLPQDEKYHITRIDPRDFIWGTDSGPLEQKWTWIAERCRISRDAAMKDPRFKRAGIPRAGASRSEHNRDPVTGGDREHDEELPLIFWEIYDLKNRQWMILFEGGTEPARAWAPFPPGVEEHPYAVLRFVLRRDNPYPNPPVSHALDPQKEISMSRSRIMRHRKRFNRKYEVDVNRLVDPDDDLHALETGDDGTVVRVMQGGAVSPISDAPLDQQTYQELALLHADIVEILGPQSGDIARTDSATAAALIDKGESAKEFDRKAQVIEFVSTLARKLDQLIQANLTTDEAILVTGPSGEAWEMVRQTDYQQVAGEFGYSVNTGASVPKLPQVERAQLMALLQVLGSFPHLLTSQRMMSKLFEMHHLDDEALLQELMQIGQAILSGQTFAPGGNASQANPISAALGAALGPQGGITNGGGSSQLAQSL